MKKINMKTKSLVKKTLLFSLLLMATLAMSTTALADCTGSSKFFETKIVTYYELPDQDGSTDSRCSYPYINGGRVCRIRMRGVIHYPKYTNDGPGLAKFPAILFNHGSEETFEANIKGCSIANYFVPRGYIVFMPFRRGQGDGDAPYPDDSTGLSDKSTGRYIGKTSIFRGAVGLKFVEAQGYCQLNSRRNKISDSDKMNPPFVIWLINDRLDANRLFPYGESRLHHCSVTASSVQMSPHSEV